MSDLKLRDACIHGRYEAHKAPLCFGGRDITIDPQLVCTCLMSEGFDVETTSQEHNSWCAVHDGLYLLIPIKDANG